MGRQIVNAYYNRANQALYTDNTMATPTDASPTLFNNNVGYTLLCNVYSQANSASYYNCSDLTDWSFDIGNLGDPVVVSSNGDINQGGDGAIPDGGLISIRINASSSELTAELGSLNYKKYYGELRANVSSDTQTVAMFPVIIKNTVA